MRSSYTGVGQFPVLKGVLKSGINDSFPIRGDRRGQVLIWYPKSLCGRVGEAFAKNVVSLLTQKAYYLAPRVGVAWVKKDLKILVRRLVDLLSKLKAPLPQFGVACAVSYRLISYANSIIRAINMVILPYCKNFDNGTADFVSLEI